MTPRLSDGLLASAVPNAPCGVERMILVNFANVPCEFLMHRVELKGSFSTLRFPPDTVPNAPCGVERWMEDREAWACGNVPNAPCGVERMILVNFANVPCDRS